MLTSLVPSFIPQCLSVEGLVPLTHPNQRSPSRGHHVLLPAAHQTSPTKQPHSAKWLTQRFTVSVHVSVSSSLKEKHVLLTQLQKLSGFQQFSKHAVIAVNEHSAHFQMCYGVCVSFIKGKTEGHTLPIMGLCSSGPRARS